MLKKKYRLHYQKDFQEIFHNGKYQHLYPFLTIHFLKKENINNPKFAFIITKKTEKLAVKRHKILRQVRHIIQEFLKKEQINQNYYYIIIIRKNFINLTFQDKTNKLLELFKLIN